MESNTVMGLGEPSRVALTHDTIEEPLNDGGVSKGNSSGGTLSFRVSVRLG